MSSVESRIVTMKFDNTQFQRGVTSTVGMLSKLKTAMTGIGGKFNPFAAIGNVASHFNLNNVSQQIAGVNAGFAAMATIAITALSNIVNKAVDAGLQIVKSLTIDPILDGYHEYETNLNSIQTILANTGLEGDKGLAKVNGALNELNRYSDKTIYNFSEMARNIGTFTAAGVSLDTSTNAIKGIANLAAVSGSNSQQASTAMYQLSQALAAGKVSLMDWNSVVNAGMGGKVFQNALMETARVHGVAIDQMVKEEGGFRNTLQNGWLTSDILTESLSKFTGDLNARQLKTMGYNDKQIAGILKLGQTATDAATKVKTMSQLMGTLQEAVGSGWSKSFQLIFGNFNEAKDLFTNVNNVLGGMIQQSANARNKVLSDWNKRGGRVVLIDAIANAFHALMRIVTPIHDAFRDIFPATTGKELFNLTKTLRDFTEGLKISGKTMSGIRSTFRGLFAIVSIGVDIIKNIIRYFATLAQLLLGGGDSVFQLTGSIGDLIVKLQQWLVAGGKIDDFFSMIIDGRRKALEPIIGLIGKLIEGLAGLITSGADKFITWMQSLAPLAEHVMALATSFKDLASTRIGEIFAQLQGMAPTADQVQQLTDSFMQLASSGIDKVFDAVSQSLSNLGPLLSNIGGAIRSAFGSLAGAAGGINLGSIFDMGDSTSVATQGINKVGGALSQTAGIADRISAAWHNVVSAFHSVVNFVAPVIDVIQSIFANLKQKVIDFVGNMGIEDGLALVNTGFFIALYVMFRQFLGKMGGVVDSLTGVFGNVSEVLEQTTANLKTMQSDVRSNMILKIAAALALLAVSLLILSKVPADQLKKSLITIGILLAGLVSALIALEKTVSLAGAAKMTVLSVALVGLGLALLSMSAAIAILGNMDASTIKQGLISIGIVLGAVVAAAAIMSKSGGAGQILIAAAALGILSVALLAFAGAVKLYAALDLSTLANGGIKIALTLTAIGLAMRAFPTTMIATAAGLAIVAGTLIVLAGALKIFGNFSVEEMAKSLIMLAGSLLIIAVALNAMTGTLAGSAAMFIMAAALAVLVPALVQLGEMSLTEIAIALGALAAVFVIFGLAGLILTPVVPTLLLLGQAILVMGAGALLAGTGLLLFSAGLTALAISGAAGVAVLITAITGIAQLIPLIVQQLGLGLLAIFKVIQAAAPEMGRALRAVLEALFNAIRGAIPEFGRMLLQLIHTGLAVLRGAFPDLVNTGFALIVALLKGVDNNIDKIIPRAVSITVKFINGIANNIHKIIEAGVNMVLKFINGVADALDKHSGEMGEAGGRLAIAIIQGMAQGIANGVHTVVDAAVNMAKSALNAAKSAIGINSPSKEFDKVGMWSAQGFAQGMDKHAGVVNRSAANLANNTLETVRKAMANASNSLTAADDIRPVIAPVLDLTQVTKDATKMHAMINGNGGIKAGVSFNRAASISADKRAAAQAETAPEPVVKEVKFEQNIHSPKALSAVQIYRQTRNQLSLAKEALT